MTLFLFLVQVSTHRYKNNHRLSKRVEKRGGRSHWLGMIINKRRIEKLNFQLWFGNNKHRETYKESENNSQELLKQKEHSSFDRNSNRVDDWFFGLRRKEPTQSTPTTQNQIENFLNNLDIELLMETYDSLVIHLNN